jgi:hypothetical protein
MAFSALSHVNGMRRWVSVLNGTTIDERASFILHSGRSILSVPFFVNNVLGLNQ